MKRRIGFTLVELLVVITIISLLAGIVLPSLGRAKELARRKVCLKNVQAIVVGMRSYATNDENQLFPNDSPTISGTSYIGIAQTLQSNNPDRDPAAGEPGEISGNAGTSRSLFLLVRGDYVGQKAFICPSARDHKVNGNTDPDDHYDFETEMELSYSLQVQKFSQSGTSTLGFPTSLLEEPDFVVLADRSPVSGIDSWEAQSPGTRANPDADAPNDKRSGGDEWMRNSFNHRQEGQVVGFVTGRGIWARHPKVGMINAAGDERDNIWCWQDPSGTDVMNAGSAGSEYPRTFPRSEPQRDSFLWP